MHVLRRMQVVGIAEGEVERAGEQLPDRGLSRTGDTHDDEGQDRIAVLDAEVIGLSEFSDGEAPSVPVEAPFGRRRSRHGRRSWVAAPAPRALRWTP
jgi:hypothetical protein